MAIWEQLARSSEIKILLELREQGEVRYSNLGKLFQSRATLDWALRQLVSRRLIRRELRSDTRPAQSFYALTPKGNEITKHVKEVLSVVESHDY